MDLFKSNNKVVLPNAILSYYPEFYSVDKANILFHKLKQETDWQSYKIRIFGKIYDQPRLTAFHSCGGKDYKYSNLQMKVDDMTPTLNLILRDIKRETGESFNSVLLNLYRTNMDSNGWHADNEKELGTNPVIASLSLGDERVFKFKHNTLKQENHKIKLKNGSLLLMEGEMQHYWKHQIPKSSKEMGERINLTFRTI